MHDAPAWDLYVEGLMPLGHGHPLWGPEPCPDMGAVRLGDVGYLADGHFCRLFNTMKQTSQQPEVEGLDELHEVFKPPKPTILRRPDAITQTRLHSKNLQSVSLSVAASAGVSGGAASAGVRFKCTEETGALLMLKDPAIKTYLSCEKHIRKYIRANIAGWLAYANDYLGLNLKEEELVFVSGHTKTSVWAEAAFHNNSSEAELVVSGSCFVPSVAGDFSVSIARSNAVVHHREGPLDRIAKWKDDNPPEPQYDQTIFVNYYRTKRRPFLGLSTLKAAAGPHELPEGDRYDDGAVEAPLIMCEDDSSETFRETYDPVISLLDYILEHSTAEVASATDDDLIRLLRNGAIPDNLDDIIRILAPQVVVDDDGVGTLVIPDSSLVLHAAPGQGEEPLKMQKLNGNFYLNRLNDFLATAPSRWDHEVESDLFSVATRSSDSAHHDLNRFLLPNSEHVSCVLWGGQHYITGTDIVRALVFRFEAFGRPVQDMKAFETHVFKDLRNLTPGIHCRVEESRSPFLEWLLKYQCIRTHRKQKIFYWMSVPHDRLFYDALERDLRREESGFRPTSIAISEPALSFTYDHERPLYEQEQRLWDCDYEKNDNMSSAFDAERSVSCSSGPDDARPVNGSGSSVSELEAALAKAVSGTRQKTQRSLHDWDMDAYQTSGISACHMRSYNYSSHAFTLDHAALYFPLPSGRSVSDRVLERARPFRLLLRHPDGHTENPSNHTTFTRNHSSDGCDYLSTTSSVHLIESRISHAHIPSLSMGRDKILILSADDVLLGYQRARMASVFPSIASEGATWIEHFNNFPATLIGNRPSRPPKRAEELWSRAFRRLEPDIEIVDEARPGEVGYMIHGRFHHLFALNTSHQVGNRWGSLAELPFTTPGSANSYTVHSRAAQVGSRSFPIEAIHQTLDMHDHHHDEDGYQHPSSGSLTFGPSSVAGFFAGEVATGISTSHIYGHRKRGLHQLLTNSSGLSPLLDIDMTNTNIQPPSLQLLPPASSRHALPSLAAGSHPHDGCSREHPNVRCHTLESISVFPVATFPAESKYRRCSSEIARPTVPTPINFLTPSDTQLVLTWASWNLAVLPEENVHRTDAK